MTVVEHMAEKKKGKYLTKSVKFGNKSMTLFSLDGTTWSTRKDELQGILERHEAERQKLLANMGEVKAQEEQEIKAAPVEEATPVVEDVPIILGEEDISDLPEEEDEEIDEESAVAKRRKATIAAAAAKSKSKKNSPNKKGKERVAFVTPKPRQIEKRKTKAAKSKKRAAA